MDNFQFLPSLSGLFSEAPTLVDLNLVNARWLSWSLREDVLRYPLSL